MKKLLLAIGIFIMGAVAAQQAQTVGKYVFAGKAMGLEKVIDSSGQEFYTKQATHGTFSVFSVSFQSSVTDVVLTNDRAAHNAYNNLYVIQYAQLARNGTGIVESKETEFKGFKTFEVSLHKSDYTPELWQKIILLRERMYYIKYFANANTDSAQVEYEQLSNAVQIVNVKPEQQFDRWNIYMKARVRYQIIWAIIIFGTFGFFYNRWDKKQSRRAEIRDAAKCEE